MSSPGTPDAATEPEKPTSLAAVAAVAAVTQQTEPVVTILSKRPHARLRELYGEAELEYYRNQPRAIRRRILEIEERLAGYNEESIPVRFKVLLSDLDEHIKAIAIRKLGHLANMDEQSGEYYKIVTWVELLCRLPFGKYASLPVNIASAPDEISKFVKGISDRLDATVYGHTECKNHILRVLCQWITNPVAKGMILGIQGAAGVGKTCLVKEGICKALGLPFAFIPLGGASDGAYLEGHSYTYEGAIPGRLVDVLIRARCMNPVLFFDETDKISQSTKGQEVTNILIHLTDSSQNERVSDRYFNDVALDFSRSLMIFSFNDASLISPILLDRMTVINASGYTEKDKLNIASRHLIPDILKEFNMAPDDIVFEETSREALIQHVIELTDSEEGVRNLKRNLHKIISSINMQRILHEQPLPWKLTTKDVQKFLSGGSSSYSKAANHMSMYM